MGWNPYLEVGMAYFADLSQGYCSGKFSRDSNRSGLLSLRVKIPVTSADMVVSM